MRITPKRLARRLSAVLAVGSLSVICGACSHSTMPGPTWNLTGGKDRTPVPPKAIYAEQPRQAALPQPAPQPLVTYRGGRDPVTGRAPSFGGTQPGLQPVSQPPALTQPRPIDKRSQLAPLQKAPVGSDPVRSIPVRFVEVRPGQSLSMIASEQRVSIGSLMAANNLRDPYVIPGQTLTIPRH